MLDYHFDHNTICLKNVGVSFDGSASHYFHRAVKAYNSGSRKRRKIYGQDDSCDVRWHKTGKTKPILLNGVHRGSKKVMVLYTTPESKDLSGKTNWIMHQYHLGTKENEKHGEYVASKIFYQQPEHVKLRGKVSPVTPNSATREPSWIKKQRLDIDQARESHHSPEVKDLYSYHLPLTYSYCLLFNSEWEWFKILISYVDNFVLLFIFHARLLR